ncbi:hypothetical protein SLE2022_040990 [Rubroshorea leprosula]
MGTNLSSWNIILSFLLLQMCAQEIEGRSLKYDPQHLLQPTSTATDSSHPSSHIEHMDPSMNIFFKVDDLKAGKTMSIWFSSKDNTSASPPLLSREEAESIPFSSKQLPYLLDLFSFRKDSPQAKAMEYTLGQCEHKPMKGETKSCPTSLESMLDFAQTVFGSDAHFKVLTTNFNDQPIVPLQNYTISKEPEVIRAPKIIGCHRMPYPYSVFYCHTQESDNRLFVLSLVGDNGERVKAPGICHMDTSQWDPAHIAFQLIRVKPRESPVCHFFPQDNLVWLPLH